MNIGTEIRRWRIRRGFQQDSLAKAVRINPSHLCRIEKGDVSPRWRLVDRILAVLRVKISLE